MSETEIAYELDTIINHLIETDDDYDGEIMEWTCPNWREIKSKLTRAQALKLSETPSFHSYSEYMEQTDYPYTDTGWPIVSKRMLDVLESVGDFSHQVIPILFQERSFPRNKDEKFSVIAEKEYCLIVLLEFLDIFDWDKSECTLHQSGRLSSIDKPVFSFPEEGLPPIFRINNFEARIFVSAATKEALETTKMSHLKFTGISKFS